MVRPFAGIRDTAFRKVGTSSTFNILYEERVADSPYRSIPLSVREDTNVGEVSCVLCLVSCVLPLVSCLLYLTSNL